MLAHSIFLALGRYALAAALAVGFCAGGSAVAATAPVLRVAGPAEVVIPAADMRCQRPGRLDVPDMPPNAFRRGDGVVVFLAGNRDNHYATGKTLDSVARHDCGSLLASPNRAEPEAFADNEWLTAMYAVSPTTVLGIVHDEYHGSEHGLPGCVVTSQSAYECWYAATTLAISNDDGRTFAQVPPPGGVVAALPYRFRAGAKRAGVFSPKVVGDPNGEFIYMLTTFLDRNRGIRARECLLRASVHQPTQWRGWDGAGFRAVVGSAYGERSAEDCVAVVQGAISTVKYLPRFKTYIALFVDGNDLSYRFSPDLVTWGAPVRLPFEFVAFGAYKRGDPQPLQYFSLLDPASHSRNFDTVDERPYLYFVRWQTDERGVVNARRDVVRVPLAFE
jgi:hypothetical protein